MRNRPRFHPRTPILYLGVALLAVAVLVVGWADWSGTPGADLLPQDTATASTQVAGSAPVTGSIPGGPRSTAGVGHRQRAQMPEALAAAVRSAVEKDSYAIQANDRHSPVSGTHQAVNCAHQLQIGFSGNGIHVRPQGTKADWELKMSLGGIGYGELKQPTGEGTLRATDSRIESQRVTATGKSLTEWYVNSPKGLEQGFTLPTPPASKRNQDDPLLVEFRVSGNVRPALAEDGRSIAFAKAGGRPVAHYSELHVYDAQGSELPSHMDVEEGRIALCVDDSTATYPVTIDPLFTTETKLTASDASTFASFGFSVALDGDTAIVGATIGKAYVFERSGSTWTEQQKLMGSDAAPGDRFGYSVALSGDTAIVTTFNTSATPTGKAYVFMRSGTTWTEQTQLTASDGAPGDWFGFSVALSADTACVGAPAFLFPSPGPGAAYVFVRSGSTWSQQKLTASDKANGDAFGASVALNADTALVGAAFDDFRGAAYVFTRSGTTWSEQQKLTASDGATGDQFGTSALSGDTALVGALFHDGRGSAYVFTRSGTTWSEQQKLTASDGAAGDRFGYAVALSEDMALVGAWEDDDAASASGSAYVFVRSGTDWSQQQKLTAKDASTQAHFGISVALSGDTAFVGANGASSTGAAYVYEQGEVSDSQGPATSAVVATPNPVAVGGTVQLTANVDDTGLGDSNIASAEYSVNGGAFTPMSASDGMFDEVAEDVTASFSAPSTAGIYDVSVRGTDEASNVGDPASTMLVVYDPSGGFVTGSGRIDSPAGAYKANTSLTGNAFFAFFSKYQKGTTVPIGSTYFGFIVGDMRFQSSSYDFLVVNGGGTNAQFKGSGKINTNLAPNDTPFKFMIWAKDDTTDTFRIRIWWEDGEVENVVYDNGTDQAIGGGVISIHTS